MRSVSLINYAEIILITISCGKKVDQSKGAIEQETQVDQSYIVKLEQFKALTRENQLIELGSALFHDTSLSEPEGLSCASCHQKDQGFTGNNNSPVHGVAKGSLPDSIGGRNVPSASYTKFIPSFEFIKDGEDVTPVGGLFWDGRALDLADQAKGPPLNPIEGGVKSKLSLVSKIKASSSGDLFKIVYGEQIFEDADKAYDSFAEAIAEFEHSETFNLFNSKFDKFLRGESNLSEKELRGFELFKEEKKGNCLACHPGKIDSKNPEDWLFTDFTYDNLGVPRNSHIPANSVQDYYDLGLCKQPGIEGKIPLEFTGGVDSLCGKFKVPSLRNVALTGPYMHNGVFKTLKEVVKFYATRDTHPQDWYPQKDGIVQKYNDLPSKYFVNVNEEEAPMDRHEGETPALNDEEIDAIVAFLETLSDSK